MRILIFFLIGVLLLCSCSRIKWVHHKPKSPPKNIHHFTQIKTLKGHSPLSPEMKHKYCLNLEKSFKKYLWPMEDCRKDEWFFHGLSNRKTPLIFSVWGNMHGMEIPAKRVTLVMCGVHGDEITPVKFCYDVLNHFKEKSLEDSTPGLYKNKVIVLAPLINPDAFFKAVPTRTNANGVDINRNFPTRGWDEKALRIWRQRYRGDKRRYPGERPASEPETIFQMALIEQFRPDKIISVHAPLTMLDYDGPEDSQIGKGGDSKVYRLLIQMSKKADGYRIKNYPFFPGSLGNYAGNERDIPTFTLELPSSDSRFHRDYWRQFKEVVDLAIDYEVDHDIMELHTEKTLSNKER